MRINKFLSQAGITSRRKADDLISAGKVSVNGQLVRELGTTIDPDKDEVSVEGVPVLPPTTERVIYLLNKPAGVVTTAHDPDGKPTVLELVPKTPRVFPCGRLDEDTLGLVVLTNDGELCYKLTHPKFEHEKEYIVEGFSPSPLEAIERIKKGVRLKDGPIKPDSLEIQKREGRKVTFSITIHEGRNHLVRRLCAQVGIEIEKLTRIRISEYKLDQLEPGKYRTI